MGVMMDLIKHDDQHGPLSAEFQHYQSAHCESGTTSNLLRHSGIPISEAMAFGIGSGIFFLHLPFVKVMNLPLTSYRSFPGTIFKKACKRLGIAYKYETFRDAVVGTEALDQHLKENRAVGLRSNIFWLPYIPESFRFQFNAHSFVVYGKRDDQTYLVSDPILETVSACASRALTKARFSKGVLAPKGLIFYPLPVQAQKLSLERAIHQGIRETVNRMLFTPLPFAGVRGIRFLSRQMSKWPIKLKNLDAQKLYLANVVRMQEEIGTGGAGFRFLYAAFLQEASIALNNPILLEASREMTDAGNVWREFATLSARFCKDRLPGDFEQIPQLLMKIANLESAIYWKLRKHYV